MTKIEWAAMKRLRWIDSSISEMSIAQIRPLKLYQEVSACLVAWQEEKF